MSRIWKMAATQAILFSLKHVVVSDSNRAQFCSSFITKRSDFEYAKIPESTASTSSVVIIGAAEVPCVERRNSISVPMFAKAISEMGLNYDAGR